MTHKHIALFKNDHSMMNIKCFFLSVISHQATFDYSSMLNMSDMLTFIWLNSLRLNGTDEIYCEALRMLLAHYVVGIQFLILTDYVV